MENNEQIEETSYDDTQETATDAEQIENQEDGQEETKDWKAEALKYKAIAERKDKKLQEKTEINKTNTEHTALSREDTIFFAQGGTEETYKIAKQIADTQGIGILAAKEDDYFKFQVEKIEKEKQVKANQIGSSTGSQTGSGHKPKPLGEMTREEHMANIKESVPGLR